MVVPAERAEIRSDRSSSEYEDCYTSSSREHSHYASAEDHSQHPPPLAVAAGVGCFTKGSLGEHPQSKSAPESPRKQPPLCGTHERGRPDGEHSLPDACLPKSQSMPGTPAKVAQLYEMYNNPDLSDELFSLPISVAAAVAAPPPSPPPLPPPPNTALDWAAQVELSEQCLVSGVKVEEELRSVLQFAPPISVECRTKAQHTASPSGYSLYSETSVDSGKGGSTCGGGGQMSPVDELIEASPVYEFEVPQEMVGLLIGKRGTTIKWLMDQSGAFIVIRDHHQGEKLKICSIEGRREEINRCLRLVRRKFPADRFPELQLMPLLPLPVASISASSTPVLKIPEPLSLPEGVQCEVILSSLVTAGHFFLQQPTHPTFPSLSRLDQYMLAVYAQPGQVPELPRPVDTGVICAAPVMGGWYRAQTMQYLEAVEEVTVRFVDYGGYSRLPASELRQIRSDFMTLPFQACECYMARLRPTDEQEGWTSEASALFEQLAYGKVITAQIVGYSADQTPLVDLFTSAEGESVLIGSVLVEQRQARWSAESPALLP